MAQISVAVAQMLPKLNALEDNLQHMSDMIAAICKGQKVDLIVFPELAVSGYECGLKFTELAQQIPGMVVNTMAQRASEFNVHVLFGMPIKAKVESIIYDGAVLIGPDGELMGDYHKVHLRGAERMVFRAGYRFPVFETYFGNLGVLIGWDLAFPEAARSLALEGIDLLAVCANWETPNEEEWHAYLMARAFENSLFVAAANRIGEEPSFKFFGESSIVGPRGEVFASVDTGVEGYGLAKLDLGQVRQMREEYQLLQYRQPLAYRSIVRKY
jgi:omega-amidase